MNFSIFLVLTSLLSIANCNIILKPTKTSNVQAGFIFVQGASIPASNYKAFALELQNKFNGSLWVVLTEFIMDLPEPLLVNSVMSSAFSDLKNSGFNYDKNTPFFFAGHSLGGIVAQNYLFGNKDNLPFKLGGLVLEGSFVLRSNLKKATDALFPPILTLGAELDGLSRLTRLTESFYHNYYDKSYSNSMTIIVNGMNHYQFSGEGKPPSNVVKNDIEPEIENAYAREQITSLINSFMNLQMGASSQSDTQLISKYLKSTFDLVSPLVEAFNLEGFYHFKPPCSYNKELRPPNCIIGSPWSERAQLFMGSIDASNLNVFNTLQKVYSLPEHFPSMKNCTAPSTCSLNISTFTENVYSFTDNFDVGLYPIAASEARTKMQSRQSVLEAFTNQKYDFNQTDNKSLCAQINQDAISYALKSAPEQTAKRYLKRGKLLLPVADVGPLNNGFLWTSTALSFKEVKDNKNRTIVEVGSPTLRLPTDYKLKFVAGFHYCKLLTPARAMEWIFIDSLKP